MSDFSEYLVELFAELGVVTIKRMFGGSGVFFDGLMIGLVADEVLFLKVDDETRDQFESRGLEPFVYEKNGRKIRMSYCEAPTEAMDAPEDMKTWAELALAAARRSKKK